jgi:hypothetical protein
MRTKKKQLASELAPTHCAISFTASPIKLWQLRFMFFDCLRMSKSKFINLFSIYLIYRLTGHKWLTFHFCDYSAQTIFFRHCLVKELLRYHCHIRLTTNTTFYQHRHIYIYQKCYITCCVPLNRLTDSHKSVIKSYYQNNVEFDILFNSAL